MSKEFIKFIDSNIPIGRENLLTALRTEPFLSHQFDWFISQINFKTTPEACEMMAGYCGLKKITPERQNRLIQAVTALK